MIMSLIVGIFAAVFFAGTTVRAIGTACGSGILIAYCRSSHRQCMIVNPSNGHAASDRVGTSTHGSKLLAAYTPAGNQKGGWV